MSLELALGIVGTITGMIGLLIHIWKTILEKPIIKISDALLYLEKDKKNKVRGKLSFNLDNIGDRSTTVTRVNVILGDHVEVIEGLRSIQSHSSIRYPKKADSEIHLFTSYEELENLRIIAIHTHGTSEKIYTLPQVSEWDKHALWKGGPLVLQP